MRVLTESDAGAAYPATPSVPDSDLHSRVRSETYWALRWHFAGRGDCFVGQDLNVYWRRGDNRTFVAPDVLVCFGVNRGALEQGPSYRSFAEGPPAFVLEIASERTRRVDLEDKPHKYLEIGVAEYWRFDPTGGLYPAALQAERRRGDRWEPIPMTRDDDGLRGHSAALDLCLHARTQRLRLRHPRTRQWLPDPTDMRHQRDAALARADAAEAELAALRARLNDQP